MLITKTIEIDAGHRVPSHKGKCRNLHGHRYKIEVGVDDKVIDEKGVSNEGMVIDYGELKRIMMNEIDRRYDHGFIIAQKDELVYTFDKWRVQGMKIIIVDFIPTAENLAKHWYRLMEFILQEVGIKIAHVKVWETPSSTATYHE